MLVHLKDLLRQIAESSAVGAFNTINLEITQGIVAGARLANKPVIIQTSENVIKYAGLRAIYNLVKSVIEDESADLSIAMHLDHGKKLEVVKACVDIGYSSVHLDASDLLFEDNIKLTQEAVEYAHRQGVWIQGELGSILGAEGLVKFQQTGEIKSFLTNPEQVKEYLERTGVDTLAVSIGNVHGYATTPEKLDLERLARINQRVNVPLVLHGGSGIPRDQLKEAIKLGIKIVNFDTDLRLAFTRALTETLTLERNTIDPRKILSPAKEAVANTVRQIIQQLKH